jgi:non-specific serine/threonine protein kinase
MGAVPAATSTTCARCGAARDTTSSADLGCMTCLLGLGFEAARASSEEDICIEQFGHYVIDKHADGRPWELGRGAMGVTYLATDTLLQRAVALKIIRFDSRRNPASARERFLREARAAAALRHPNIATVYQFGMQPEGGQCFYAMELVEGETLEERIRRRGPFDVPTAIDIGRQVADALAAAQKRGLVHRDIKPANLMVLDERNSDELTVKIIDFGVAKALIETSDERVLTREGFVGTPAFASPEQFTNRAVDVRSDIYSLGATLWYLLTGRTPFGDSTSNDQRAAPPIEQLKIAKVPSRFIELLASMVAAEPAARPGIAELARRLEALQFRSARKNRAPLLLAGTAILLALITAVTLQRRQTMPLPEKSIAVLPFDSFGNEKENLYFADGIQDDVLTNLAKVADLKVISRTSVMQYRNATKNMREIGSALRVAHVLEGSVQRSGNRIRVNAQLIDTRTDAHLWAEQYERDVSDVFAIQSELSHRIVAQLRANLSPTEKASIDSAPTRDVAAYDLYLKARELTFGLPTAKDWEADATTAIDLLNQAIQRDSDFALAYCLLSRLQVDFYWEKGRNPVRLEQARVSVDAAMRLAPDSGEARFARGFYFYHGVEDNERALIEFTAAKRALPNNADVFSWSGILERRIGHWADALNDLRRASELDPHNAGPPIDLIITYEALRNYTEAQLTIDRALIALPQLTNRFRTRKADIALLAGDTAAARAALASLPSDYKQGGGVDYLQARLAFWTRDYAEAARLLNAVPLSEASTFTKAWVARDQALLALAQTDTPARSNALAVARDAWRVHLEAHGDEAEARSWIAIWDAASGNKTAAFSESDRAIELRPLSRDATNAPVLLTRRVLALALCDERELALNQLEALVKIPGGVSPGDLKLNPAWDVLRGEPRFEKVLAESATPLVASNVTR